MYASTFAGKLELLSDRDKWSNGAGRAHTSCNAGDGFAGFRAAWGQYPVPPFGFEVEADPSKVYIGDASFLVANQVCRGVDDGVEVLLETRTVLNVEEKTLWKLRHVNTLVARRGGNDLVKVTWSKHRLANNGVAWRARLGKDGGAGLRFNSLGDEGILRQGSGEDEGARAKASGVGEQAAEMSEENVASKAELVAACIV